MNIPPDRRPRFIPAGVKATRVDDYQGKRCYRFPVYRRLVDASIEKLQQTELETLYVIAHKPGDAANWALEYTLDEMDGEPCEVFAIGARGGCTLRYVGWHGVIAHGLSSSRRRREQRMSQDTLPRLDEHPIVKGYFRPGTGVNP